MEEEALQRMRAAFDRVKEFPEFMSDERARWLELRQAVEEYLKTKPSNEREK